MASKGNETLDLTLVFGQKKIPIHLDLALFEDPADHLTVAHLSEAVAKETQIQPSNQKLIFRGKTLFKTDRNRSEALNTTLSSLGIRNGDRVMLLGRKPTAEKKEDDESNDEVSGGDINLGKLEELEKQADRLCSTYQDNLKVLKKTKDLNGLKKCKKMFISLNEDCMKLLERIDSTPSNDNEEFRKQRKSLVQTVQRQMDVCDGTISETSEKIKKLDQAS